MNNFKLPVVNIKPLSRISPSRYYSFTLCNLKEILIASRQSALLPVSPAARIGSVVHFIIEMATAGKIRNEVQFDEIWRKEISKQEAMMSSNPLEYHLVPLEETSHDYEVKKIMTLQMIVRFFYDGQHHNLNKEKSAQRNGWKQRMVK